MGAIAEFFTAIHESIPQLHDQGIEVENVSEEVLQVMIEIKRWITETKRPYPSLEEDPHFYLLLTENIAILQIAEREYLNICKAFFGYKQNEIKPKVRKKRFRSATEMNQHSNSRGY